MGEMKDMIERMKGETGKEVLKLKLDQNMGEIILETD